MSTPVIIATRQLFPEAKITVLGLRHNCQLLAACDLVDEIIESPGDPMSIRNRQNSKKLRELLVNRQFDLGIILLGHQYAYIMAAARIPVRIGGRNTPGRACLTHKYDDSTPRTWGPPEQLNALRVLGYDIDDIPPRLWVAESARCSAKVKLKQFGLKDDSYFVLHPFGSTKRQWWPKERVNDLVSTLSNRYGLQTILVGGPETKGEINIAGETGIDSTGRLTLQELLAVIEGARLIITTDSGPYHIAGALSRPIVGLFRARRPEHARRYQNSRVLLGQNKGCEKSCAWDHCNYSPCRQLETISVQEIGAAVEALLMKQRASSSDNGR